MRELAKQMLTLAFGRGVLRLSQFVAFIVIARHLTAAEFGWFGLVTTAIGMAATLGSLGLRQSFAYQIGRGNMSGADAAKMTLILWPALTVISTAAVMLFVADSMPTDHRTLLTVIVGAAVGGAIALTLYQGIFLGTGHINAFTTSESAPRLLLLVISVALALAGTLNLLGALGAQAAGYILVLPFLVWAVRSKGAGTKLPWNLFPPMLRYGIAFAVNLFLITLLSRLSLFVVQTSMGANASGEFFAALRINEMFLEIATVVGLVLFSNTVRAADTKKNVEENARIAAWMLLIFVGLAALSFILAEPMVKLLLGAEYLGAVPAIRVLVFGLPAGAASKVVYPTIAGSGRPLVGTPAIVISAALTLLLAALLVPGWGLTGGAAGLVVGQWALYSGYSISAGRTFDLPLKHFFVPEVSGLRKKN